MAMKVIMARDPLFEDVKKFVQQQFAMCLFLAKYSKAHVYFRDKPFYKIIKTNLF